MSPDIGDKLAWQIERGGGEPFNYRRLTTGTIGTIALLCGNDIGGKCHATTHQRQDLVIQLVYGPSQLGQVVGHLSGTNW